MTDDEVEEIARIADAYLSGRLRGGLALMAPPSPGYRKPTSARLGAEDGRLTRLSFGYARRRSPGQIGLDIEIGHLNGRNRRQSGRV